MATKKKVQKKLWKEGDVIHQANGLVWYPVASAEDLTLAQAREYTRGLRRGGFDDWRLPTIAELRSLKALLKTSPAFRRAGFGGLWRVMHIWPEFWTCEAHGKGIARYSFLDIVERSRPDDKNAVLCVRGVLEGEPAPVKTPSKAELEVRGKLLHALGELASSVAKDVEWPDDRRELETVLDNIWSHDAYGVAEDVFDTPSGEEWTIAEALLRDLSFRSEFESMVADYRKGSRKRSMKRKSPTSRS